MKKELNNNRKEVCGIIYAIRNKVNDKYYIGQTVNDNIYIRYNIGKDMNPIKRLGEKHHNEHLRNAINKYGYENFEIIEVLDKAYSYEELDNLEKDYIFLCKTEHGGVYNKTSGGKSNYKISEESKKKVSNSLKKFYESQNEEEKEKRSENISKGLNNFYANESEEHRQKRIDSINNFFDNESEEHKNQRIKKMHKHYDNESEEEKEKRIEKMHKHYDNESEEHKEKRIKNCNNGFDNSMSMPIICITFVEKNINHKKIFKTINEAVSYFKENNIVKYISEAKISNNCKGKINFASKLLNDGTPLVFKFLFDIDKEYLLKIKEEEIDNEQIELIDIWLKKIEDPEFLKNIKNRIKKIEKIANKTGKNNSGVNCKFSKTLYSSTLNKIFFTAKEAQDFTRNKTKFKLIAGDTSKCCRGILDYSGVTVDGIKIRWNYIDTCNKEELICALNNETDSDKINFLNKELKKFEDLEYVKLVETKRKTLEEKNKIKTNSCKIPVYCLTLNKVFTSLKEAKNFTENNKLFKGAAIDIGGCCRGEKKHSGRTKEGKRLRWMYISDLNKQTLEELLKNETEEEKINIIKKELLKFENVQCIEEKDKDINDDFYINKRLKPIYSPTLNMLFISILEAEKFSKKNNLNCNKDKISCCCSGKEKYSGKLANGMPIKWISLSDCNKQILENLLINEKDEVKIILIKKQLEKLENPEYAKMVEEKVKNNNEISIITNTKPVYCITLNKIFLSIQEAYSFLNDKNCKHGFISDCCNNIHRSAGILPDGTPLTWKFVCDCNKSELEIALKEETNELNIEFIKEQLRKFKDAEYEKLMAKRSKELEKERFCKFSINGNSKPIYSITLNMLFINFNEINEFFKNTNCKYGSEIVKCCKGKKEFSGELQDGTPMKWTYLSDCNKQMLEKLLEKETNELKIYLVKEELKKFEDLEYEKLIEEKSKKLEEERNNHISIKGNLKPVYSSTFDMVFISIKEAYKFVKNNNFECTENAIIKYCRGFSNYGGKTKDNVPIEWTYLSNVSKQKLEKLLKNETDNKKRIIIKKELKKFEDTEYEKLIKEKNKKLRMKKANINNNNNKINPIYSPTLNMLFVNLKEIDEFSKESGINLGTSISKCCRGERNSSGKLTNGTPIKWQYLSDVNEQDLKKLLISEKDEQKINLIKEELVRNNNPKSIKFTEEDRKIAKQINSSSKPIYCPVLNKVFSSAAEADKFTRNKDSFKHIASNISMCCKGIIESSGETIDGKKLTWKYLSDIDKQTLKELLKNEKDKINIYLIKRELIMS